MIVLHGYSASGAVHQEDGAAFVGEHTEVLLPDAPGHGERDDGRLERIRALPDDARLAAMLDVARQWADELPSLAADCRARGAARIGVVGISMGGFAALGALASPGPFAAVAALLAAPTLLEGRRIAHALPPVLLGLAGRDAAVAPEPGRRFAAAHAAELHEYPESEHQMRAQDWFDLWAHTARFLHRHLGRA